MRHSSNHAHKNGGATMHHTLQTLTIIIIGLVMFSPAFAASDLNKNGIIEVNATGLRVLGTGNFTGAFYLGNSACTGSQVLTTNSAGLVSCATAGSGSGNITGSGAAGNISYWTNSTNLANSNIYYSGGNIGIGTSPRTNLDVNGYILASGVNPRVYIGNGSDPNSNTVYAFDNSVNMLRVLYAANIGAGATVPFVINGSSGNVGIGTVGPGAKLEVTGDILLTEGAARTISVRQGSTYENLTIQAGSNNLGSQVGGDLILNPGSGGGGAGRSGNVYIATNAYSTGGRVGIGTTGPTATLTVNGSSATGSLLIQNTTGSNFFVNGSSGFVGIGTGIPTSALEIIINDTSTPVSGAVKGIRLTNYDTSASSMGGILFRAYDSTSVARHSGAIVMKKENAWNVASEYPAYIAIWTRGMTGDETERMRITGNGTVQISDGTKGGNATGVNDLYVQSDIEYDGILYGPGADLAELIYGSEALEAGDVVVADGTKDETAMRTNIPYNTAVIGIVSSEPGITLSKNKGDVPLALSGRVPIKVTTENGPIHPGDLLTTSSTPGHAMRCASRQACQGAIVAKSLGTLESGTGKVIALVMLG